MIALLRYAFLRSAREQFLYALLLGPAVMVLSPLLAVGVWFLVKGHPMYPISFDPRIPAEVTSQLMGTVALNLASLAAGTGSFWIFRREVANRSVGFFLLAAHPPEITLAATLYGFLSGMAASLIALAGIAALTLHSPASGKVLVMTMVSSMAASALGTLLVSISSEPSMLLPVYAGSFLISVPLLAMKTPAALPGTVIAIVLFATLSSLLLRWRCAI